jgi:hypothetical protein
MPSPAVIWSCCHTGPFDEDHVHRVIEAAATEGADGVEISSSRALSLLTYPDYPALAATVDLTAVAQRRAAYGRIAAHAAERGLRLGMWYHDVSGPDNLLELVPELRADDGLLDIESPALYSFVQAKLRDFFSALPTLDEVVLVLTETAFPVAHRPFCDVPPAERLRRLLQALADVTEAQGADLVIRPFSAVREDELAVRDAVLQLDAERVTLMYKTEPFDWHAFLDNESLIGSVTRYPCRAETDCGAEYYGQGVFPVCYTGHIRHRLAPALARGATSVTLRVDRGAYHSSLDHPVNTANIVPVTRWLQAPDTPLRSHLERWFAARHGGGGAVLAEIAEDTFAVIRQALYIDQQALSHQVFPCSAHAKHILLFALFEPDVDLAHLREVWSVVPGRRTLTHAEILAEKESAVRRAEELVVKLQHLVGNDASPDSLPALFGRLVHLARATEALCRVAAAHIAETGGYTQATDGFDAEAARFLALADEIDAAYGPLFFPAIRRTKGLQMAAAMRDMVAALAAERQCEFPQRRELDADPELIDYVLCGYASEGHQVGKRLHTGATSVTGDDSWRETGSGIAGAVGYTLQAAGGAVLEVTVSDDGAGRPGVVRLDDDETVLPGQPVTGHSRLECALPTTAAESVRVSIWSTSPVPVRVHQLRVVRSRGDDG